MFIKEAGDRLINIILKTNHTSIILVRTMIIQELEKGTICLHYSVLNQ